MNRMIQKRVDFKNENGFELSGLLQLPQGGKPKTFALFAHCFTCTKNLKAINHIGNALAENGIGVLKFDFTGLGGSEGEFSDTNFSSNVDDIIAACKFMEKEYSSPSIMIGHSLGGSAVLSAAAKIDSCKAVVTIGSPSTPSHLGKHFQDHYCEIEEKGEAEVNIGGRSFKIKKQFMDDLKNQSVLKEVENLKKPLLIMHAPFDKIVGINNAEELYVAAKHPKSFISLDDADHLLSKSDDSFYAGKVIASWASKYIETEEENQIDLKGNQVLVETYEKGFFSNVSTKDHHFVADEPESFGGTNKGPTPYDLLLAALGTCTNMTLRMYADRKEISLERIVSRLNHEKVHIEDCEDCEEKDKKIDLITKEIELHGDLTEEQIERLLEIADKCPVHRTLKSDIKIESKQA